MEMGTQISINRERIWRVTNLVTFKYLGAILTENGEFDAKMTHIVQSGWKNLEEGIGDYV